MATSLEAMIGVPILKRGLDCIIEHLESGESNPVEAAGC